MTDGTDPNAWYKYIWIPFMTFIGYFHLRQNRAEDSAKKMAEEFTAKINEILNKNYMTAERVEEVIEKAEDRFLERLTIESVNTNRRLDEIHDDVKLLMHRKLT